MKNALRASRPPGRRRVAGLAAGALVAGLFGLVPSTTAAAASTPLEVVDGDVYGWGWESGTESGPWESEFPNDQAPFVDVATSGNSRGNQTTLAVTASGDIVTQGDDDGIVTLMPTSLASKHVIAIDVLRSTAGNGTVAAAVTDAGGITTWGTATPPPAEYQDPTTPTGVVDVQVGTGFGIALKDDGTLVAWGNQNIVDKTPAGSDFVKIIANQSHALALTTDGKVYAWHNQGNTSGRFQLEAPTTDIVDIGIGGASLASNVGYAVTSEGEVITWGGGTSGPRPEHIFPNDQVGDPVIALSETAGTFWGGVALTDQGEFVGWAGAESISTPQIDLEGHQVEAFSFAELSHFEIIFGAASVEPPEPGVVDRPRVTGDPVIGTSLTGTPATWNFPTTSEVHGWYTAATPDAPQAEWTLVTDANPLDLTEALESQYVVYRSEVQDESGQSYVADSTPIGPIETLDPAVVEDPRIQGDPLLNSKLIGVAARFNFTPATVTSGWYHADSPDAAPEEWQPVGVENPLTLTAPETGKYLVFRTEATDPDGGSWSVDSEPIGPVVKFEVVTPPSIEGEPVVGSTLTGVPAAFSYEPESVKHFWLIGGTEVVNVDPGVLPELELTDAHVGKSVKLFAQGQVGNLYATGFSGDTAAVAAPAPSTTTVAVSRPRSTWGKVHRVSVTVTSEGEAASGSVVIKVGARTRRVALDDAGKASLRLPKSFKVGKYRVTADYAGSTMVLASQDVARLRITKARVKLSEKFPSRIRKRKRVKALVRANVVGTSLDVRGKVKIYRGKRLVGKGKLRNGKVRIRLARLPKGKNRLVMKLAGRYNTKSARKRFVIRVR